ncbi:hypothetical protein IWX90DRAFT_297853 [Phyllosticta citrichinensis]|uniref:Uncharacterized protein n=1 Tax=Phyllosticta citrichinensis TaxID=1130410 RepID=A0ABR1XKH6_9PEZI
MLPATPHALAFRTTFATRCCSPTAVAPLLFLFSHLSACPGASRGKLPKRQSQTSSLAGRPLPRCSLAPSSTLTSTPSSSHKRLPHSLQRRVVKRDWSSASIMSRQVAWTGGGQTAVSIASPHAVARSSPLLPMISPFCLLPYLFPSAACRYVDWPFVCLSAVSPTCRGPCLWEVNLHLMAVSRRIVLCTSSCLFSRQVVCFAMVNIMWFGAQDAQDSSGT